MSCFAKLPIKLWSQNYYFCVFFPLQMHMRATYYFLKEKKHGPDVSSLHHPRAEPGPSPGVASFFEELSKNEVADKEITISHYVN